jgi:hypothetical protein
LLDDVWQHPEFLSTITLRSHLERIPDPDLRARYVSELASQAAADGPPYLIGLLAAQSQRKSGLAQLRHLALESDKF